jgi:hypothetical protein
LSVWLQREPTWSEARRDAAAAWNVACRRVGWVAVFILAFSAMAVAWRLFRERTYPATVVMRVTETRIDPSDEGRTAIGDAELAAYISEAFLTRTALAAMMDAHGLYPELRRRQASVALARMQDDIHVAVAENYFAPERFMGDPVKSARVIITYDGETPEKALAVARELGTRIARERSELRRGTARANADVTERAVSAAEQELLSARREQAKILANNDDTPLALIRLAGLGRRIAQLQEELAELGRNRTDYALQEELEDRDLGLRFELVDPGRVPTAALGRAEDAVLFGILALIMALPLGALGVGVLRGEVAGARDLERLGIARLGTISGGSP